MEPAPPCSFQKKDIDKDGDTVSNHQIEYILPFNLDVKTKKLVPPLDLMTNNKTACAYTGADAL